MTILIAPDIFGVPPALTRLVELLGSIFDSETLVVVNPYEGGQYFKQEANAYDHFSAHVGIPAYGRHISSHLANLKPPISLIGFSAGASAIWQISNDNSLPEITGAIGFYGSQIRHHTQILPRFDTHLIFPESESHFDVDGLIQTLSTTPKVFPTKAPGGHGFMNEYSKNFDPGLSHKFLHTEIPELFAHCPKRKGM